MKTKTWEKIKEREVEFLRKFNFKIKLPPYTVPDLTQRKLQAMRRSDFSLRGIISESGFAKLQDSFNYNDMKFAFAYQRINLNMTDSLTDHPYRGVKLNAKKHDAYFMFTSSGQSALSCSFMAAVDVYKTSQVFLKSNSYYESIEFFKKYKFHIRDVDRIYSSTKSDILLIDSSASLVSSTIREKKWKLVVIDTTCWSLSDKTISKYVKHFLHRKIDILLARSHIKIDCLGTERNRLGSLFIISSKNNRHEIVRTFRDSLNHHANYWSARADLNQVYPFFKDAKFQNLNDAWIGRVKASCRRVYAKVTGQVRNLNRIKILEFPHGLFFWITFDHLNLNEVNSKTEDLLKRLVCKKIPAARLASYPWDFVSLTTFEKVSLYKESKLSVLRISVPDLPIELERSLAKVIIEWIHSIEESHFL